LPSVSCTALALALATFSLEPIGVTVPSERLSLPGRIVAFGSPVYRYCWPSGKT
jgi:hypothetical protein